MPTNKYQQSGSEGSQCSSPTTGSEVRSHHILLATPASSQSTSRPSIAKMSTHFRPRATTPGAPSPTRPSTARSTIRAISPSPPSSLNEASRQDSATTGSPIVDTQGTSANANVRPKSDGYQRAYVHGSGHEETDFANYTTTAGNGNVGSSPANITANVTIKRGGGMMTRRSPVKRGSRSTSPKKRPYSTPTELSSHRESTSRDQHDMTAAGPQDEETQTGDYIDSDTYTDCPDTPTPMTNSQKRSAYLPLGTPTPFPKSTRSSKSRSKSSFHHATPTATPTAPAPKLEFFDSFDDQPSYGSGAFNTDHPQVYVGPEDKLMAFYTRTERRKMRERALARAAQPEMAMPGSQTGYATTSDHPANDALVMQQPLREEDIRARMHLAPPQQAMESSPRKSVSEATGNVAWHVSPSESSYVSGGTVTSKRSVFSTPGRDELERKKAVVETDDGPFAKAVSMADLDERRRVVSEEGARGTQTIEDLEAEGRPKRKKESRTCGMGIGCNVM
ncbi:hypothetical protein BKA58DRAFT_399843 [Alternaria rosae]|uniref:uncharacterized protein n=1 Tax=Alternaria rosae TaxID=1187941 RepID=UPI001E8E9ABD|nr:uncharacterized protein BKA58DRAFT_399843 [Alternaria rosae]KAH6875664.1 hypothetical protein BKA58DRAFT_399843 [Alternaria rosae]